jgi:hypothetical protein
MREEIIFVSFYKLEIERKRKKKEANKLFSAGIKIRSAALGEQTNNPTNLIFPREQSLH